MTYTMCDCPEHEGPHDPSMRCVLRERERADRVADFMVQFLSTSLCERHAERLRQMSAREYVEEQQARGCVECQIENARGKESP